MPRKTLEQARLEKEEELREKEIVKEHLKTMFAAIYSEGEIL